MKNYGGFEHNLQSLRVVDELEEKYAQFNGLNLTFESREGILKHCSKKNARDLGALGQRFIEGTYPFVRVSDLAVKKKTNNLTIVRDYINNKCLNEKKIVHAKKGTIVFPKSGAAVKNNNRAELGIDAYIVSHLAAVYAIKNKALNRFLYYILSNIDMLDYVGDKGYPSLRTTDIKTIKIPIR